MQNSDEPFLVPILFIIFNRPHQTKSVFEALRKIKPSRLYIAADGPRPSSESDLQKCQTCKEIVEDISWPCEVRTLFREKNLGCKKAVSGAIDWFFEDVEEGIILEDDCLPSTSFFLFCKTLLSLYSNDERIMQISGTNLLEKWRVNECDYFFSYFGSVWGWATWRRAWKYYDVNMPLWNNPQVKKAVEYILADKEQFQVRKSKCDAVVNNQVDTWDYQWTFCKLINSGLSINPSLNLVSNIGFDAQATHTKNDSILNNLSRHEIKFTINQNHIIVSDREFDKHFHKITQDSPWVKFISRIRSIFLK